MISKYFPKFFTSFHQAKRQTNIKRESGQYLILFLIIDNYNIIVKMSQIIFQNRWCRKKKLKKVEVRAIIIISDNCKIDLYLLSGCKYQVSNVQKVILMYFVYLHLSSNFQIKLSYCRVQIYMYTHPLTILMFTPVYYFERI